MIVELKIPSPGESISEVEIAGWLVDDGDYVEKNQEIAEVESDKATLPLIAPESGKISMVVKAGDTIPVGSLACTIDTAAKGKAKARKKPAESIPEKESEPEKAQPETRPESEKPATASIRGVQQIKKNAETAVKVTPLARKMMDEYHLSVDDILNGLRKITTEDVNRVLSSKPLITEAGNGTISRKSQRSKISQLRKKLSQRLVSVKNETAMLTTFNEVDMSRIIAARQKYQKKFGERFGIKLGYMSFFVKAATLALKIFPKVNAQLDGDEMVMPEFVDIGIAVQTEKGLMVPVIRNTGTMNLARIEQEITILAEKARTFKISIEEMTGGTFTITNGGIFGSMLSTPIINPPQSAILGMHNIVDRPVAINGKVEIRPVMYVALSYDHRLVDGKDSVSFLAKVKEFLENPSLMVYNGSDPEKLLIGLD